MTSVPDLTKQLTELREAMARAVRTNRAALAALEDERDRVFYELHQARALPMRQRLLAVRRALLAAFHRLTRPAGTFSAVVSRLAVAAGVQAALNLYELLRYRSCSFQDLPEHDRTTDQPDAAQAIRWLGPVRIAGVVRRALFCHPISSVSYTVRAGAQAKIRADCALLPSVWAENWGGVEFTLSASALDGSWTRVKTRRVDPGRRIADRRWRPLQLSLPTSGSEFLVTLATRLPADAGTTAPWAVWGAPRLVVPRTVAELWRAVRTELRRSGVRNSWRKLRDLRQQDEANARYRQWLRAHALDSDALARVREEAARLPYRPLISVITPVYDTDGHWLRACIESVRRQLYPHWELCLADDASRRRETHAVLEEYRHDGRIRITRLTEHKHIAEASNAALALATGEFVAFLDHDDELAPDALYEVARLLNEHAEADLVYTDEDKLELDGTRCDPFFKPDWSPEFFRSYMYTCHLMVLRRSLVEQVGGFRQGYEGAQDYDLALRVVERTDRIYHIPKVLYHWRKTPGSAAAENAAKPWALDAAKRALEDHVRRTNLDAEVLPGHAPGLFRVKHRLRGQPLVTIIVPTDDRQREIWGRPTSLLVHCVQSVVQKTAYTNYELLIVDNGRLSESTLAYLRQIPHRRVSFYYTGAFNFASKLNFAVSHARGEQLVVFNDDLEVIASEWLTAMLEYSQQDAIGAVGAKLLFPDGRIQHVGIVLGVCGVAAHAFYMHPGSSVGYGGSAVVVRNYSAVTGACMMTRREVFDKVGGFDERFAVDFNDVDYCLRVRQAGYRVVFTPYALLFHHEAGTLGPRLQDRKALAEMRRLWTDAVERDPYYNPNLTRLFPDFRLRAETEDTTRRPQLVEASVGERPDRSSGGI